jgi:hypothetical protein
MPKSDFDALNNSFSDINSSTSVEVKQQITKLKRSHKLRAKMINLEFWALAGTMDDFLPGFWSRFLANRRTSLRQFIKRKRSHGHPLG